MGDLERIRTRFVERAAFAVIYIQEAHPSDGWQVDSNLREGLEFTQPVSFAERRTLAVECRDRLGITVPLFLDGMENALERAYRAWPERLFVISRQGRIVYLGGRGPYGFLPNELEQFLEEYLR